MSQTWRIVVGPLLLWVALVGGTRAFTLSVHAHVVAPEAARDAVRVSDATLHKALRLALPSASPPAPTPSAAPPPALAPMPAERMPAETHPTPAPRAAPPAPRPAAAPPPPPPPPAQRRAVDPGQMPAEMLRDRHGGMPGPDSQSRDPRAVPRPGGVDAPGGGTHPPRDESGPGRPDRHPPGMDDGSGGFHRGNDRPPMRRPGAP